MNKYYLHFKSLYSRRKNLDALFLTNVFKNKIDYCSLWTLLVSVYALNNLDTFPPLTSVMSQNASHLQIAGRFQQTKHLPSGYILLSLILQSYVIIVCRMYCLIT
jgi:hypothetical protein